MQWLPLLLVGLATGIYAAVCAGEDAYQIARNADVSHLWQGRQRGATLGGFALLAYNGHLWPLTHWCHALAPVAAFGAALCLFGFCFDLWLNQRRALVWYYTGTDPQTATADQLVNRLRITGPLYPALKLAGVLIFGTASLLLT